MQQMRGSVMMSVEGNDDIAARDRTIGEDGDRVDRQRAVVWRNRSDRRLLVIGKTNPAQRSAPDATVLVSSRYASREILGMAKPCPDIRRPGVLINPVLSRGARARVDQGASRILVDRRVGLNEISYSKTEVRLPRALMMRGSCW